MLVDHVSIRLRNLVNHLLHENSVVAFKGGVHLEVRLHGANLVLCREALAAAALSAVLQDLHPVPGGCCFEAARQHMNCLGIRLGCEGNILHKA